MQRTIITPVTTNVNLSIPKEYLGKKVEILLYAIDEMTEQKTSKKNNMASFWGTLNPNDAKELRKHVKQSRDEWERDI